MEAVDLVGDEGEIVGGKVEFQSGSKADVGVGSEVVSVHDAVKGSETGAAEFGEAMAAMMALNLIRKAASKGLTSDQWYLDH